MTLSSILSLALVCLVAMLSPGPDFILVSKNALTKSFSCGLATAFGIVFGCLFHATYCVLGLALIITQSIVVFNCIKYLGAAYLIYIGCKALFSKGSTSLEINQIQKKNTESIFQNFIDGLLCNLLNPKLAVFLLSLFTQFIDPTSPLLAKTIVAGIFIIESALYWPLLVILLQRESIRSFFEKRKSAIDRFCGGLLIALGVRVAAT